LKVINKRIFINRTYFSDTMYYYNTYIYYYMYTHRQEWCFGMLVLTLLTSHSHKRSAHVRGPGSERESGGRVVGGIPLRPSRTAQERERKHYKTIPSYACFYQRRLTLILA